MNALSTKLDNKNWHFSNATLCSLLFYSGYVCSHLFLLNKNHLSINQELIPNLLKMTLPVLLLIFHAFVVLFDDTKSKTEATKSQETTLKDRTFNVVKDA